MNKLRHDEIDPRLVSLLDELKPAPARDPKRAASARAQFLSKAVSVQKERRLSLWTIFQRKEQRAMKLIMSMLVIAGLLLGGNAAVSAAQDDLPTEPLYPIKLMSEDVNLWRLSDPAAKIEMLMQQAQTRTQEMATLVESGITPPAELGERAQERIQQALQLATNLDDPTATLQQIRTQLQTHEQLISRLQNETCEECEPILQKTQAMLRTRLRQIEGELDHPRPSSNQNQNQNQLRITLTPVVNDKNAAPQTSHTPVLDGTRQQNGSGNPLAGTPMPQNYSTNQNGGGTQNNSDGDGSPQNGNDNSNEGGNGSGDAGGNGNGQGSDGQGGKP